MSITKNHQSYETLHALAAAAFPDKQVRAVTELTEGMFNAVYRFDFMDDTASILKVAAASTEGLLSNEINLMQAEVSAMKLLRSRGVPYIPQVQFSDFSRTLCSGTYFFMEAMPGRSLNSCQAEMSEDAVNAVLHEVGLLQRQTADIHRMHFGLAGDDRLFDTLYDMVYYMFSNVLRDAAKKNVAFCFAPCVLRTRLERDRACFDQVRLPSLVHWDMWEGNIFVHEGRLSGVIDWERTVWGDPLMEDRFRTKSWRPAFLEGFGKTIFTLAEKRRILWYDVFLYVTMLTECHYRQYENSADWALWLTHLLEEAWQALERPVKDVPR